MQRARLLCVMVMVLASAGCADAPAPTTGPDQGTTSTGASSSEGDGPPGAAETTIGVSSSDTHDSHDPVPHDGTSTSDVGLDDTSSGGCPLGAEGCPCDAGGCEGALSCLGDVCQVPLCDGDGYEPNDGEANPTDLGQINDNDSNGGIVSGSLHHLGDVDWYRYQGDDDIGHGVDPTRELASSAGVRLCKFIECDVGLAQTNFECPPGTQYALSTMARPGCCSSGGIALPSLNCTGVISDDAAVYIRVDQPEQACTTYSVAYHY